MNRIYPAGVPETLLPAPGWARVGLTAPTRYVRVEAAFELARAIAESLGENGEPAHIDQLGLSL